MTLRLSTLPAWIDDERSLLAYLVRRHGAHAYAEDVLDAVALVTCWTMAAFSVLAVLGVVLDRLI